MTIYPIVILPSTYPQILTRYYGSNYITQPYVATVKIPFIIRTSFIDKYNEDLTTEAYRETQHRNVLDLR
jgi:hypothetical protein